MRNQTTTPTVKTRKTTLLRMAIFLVLITGCSSKSKELLPGEWKLHSSIDLETNTIDKAEDDKPIYAILNKDSIILTDKKDMEENKEFRWHLKQDSLIVISDGDSLSVYLKELNEKKLIVDYDWFGVTRLIFEKNE